jgi:Bacteriophage HK97-gp10, putative tail-component
MPPEADRIGHLMAAPAVVTVVGLKALRKDIDQLAKPDRGPLNDALKAAGRKAAEPVVEAARNAVPHDSGTLAGSVRLSATRTGARVRMGKQSVPYAGPVEFGGWPEGRAYVKDGRYLFPAAHRLGTVAERLYNTEIGRALDRFHWTNTIGTTVHD